MTFIAWLRTTRTNAALTVPWVDPGPPQVTVSDAQRWAGVEHLLHDEHLRSYTRLGGLFTLLFAQPLSRIVAMRTDQVTTTPDGSVHITFGAVRSRCPRFWTTWSATTSGYGARALRPRRRLAVPRRHPRPTADD